MRKLLIVIFMILVQPVYSGGPYFQHKDPITQQEFEWVYKSLRSGLTTNSGVRCIDSPTFCVDTVNNRVGILDSSPEYDVDLSTDKIGGSLIFRISNSDNTNAVSHSYLYLFVGGANSGDPYIRYLVNGVSQWASGIDNSDSDKYKISNNSALGTNDYFIIDVDGAVTKPLQPSFLVTAPTNSDNVTGNGSWWLAEMDTEIRDRNGDFTPTAGNYKFTAPVDGDYLLSASLVASGFTSANDIELFRIVTSNRNYEDYSTQRTGAQHSYHICVVADMEADDIAYVQLYVEGEGSDNIDPVDDPDRCFFSGTLIN